MTAAGATGAARPAPAQPVVLPSNRPAARFYRGGARIAAFRGLEPVGDHEPEDWIASTTCVSGRPRVGETVLPDGSFLTDAIAADPVGWLGADHVAARGPDTGLLTKLLDAGQRLPVHAHPDGAFARHQLGRAHGKTEAWVVLTGGTVHLGLQRDVEEQELRRLVDDQRSSELLGLLHAIEVAAGDAVLVPAGQLHAIGQGVLLLEVQEPEDLSILLEWRDFAIDGAADGHLGLGFEAALRAVDRRRLDPHRLAALITRQRASGPLLPEAAEAFFRVDRRPVERGWTLQGFCVVVVEQGEVDVGGVRLRRGSTAVLPAAAGPVAVDGAGTLLVCRPPAP